MNPIKEEELINKFLIEIDDLFQSEQIEALAHQSGFVQRRSPLGGHLFLTAFVFGVSIHDSPTLEQLCGLLHTAESHLNLSRQGLDQRINEQAVEFFELLLSKAFHLQLPPELSMDLLSPFTQVVLLDSTGFQLPEHLADLFPGFGGGASPAGLKIQFGYDLKSGRFFIVFIMLSVPITHQRTLFWKKSKKVNYVFKI